MQLISLIRDDRIRSINFFILTHYLSVTRESNVIVEISVSKKRCTTKLRSKHNLA